MLGQTRTKSSAFGGSRRALGAAAIVLLVPSCGSPSGADRVDGRYVGKIESEDAAIGLVVHGRDIAAYVCPRDAAVESYPGWFFGRLARESQTSSRLVAAGYVLDLSWSDSGASGTLISHDEPAAEWTAWPARDNANLYGTYDQGCLTGVVVLDPSAHDIRGAWCNAAGLVRQVTPVDPPWTEDGGLRVQVELDLGARQLVVSPVELPLRAP